MTTDGIAKSGQMTGFSFPPFSTVPMTRLGAPKRVLVLGAGMSGLVAAYTLRQAGHHVQVLEAKQHPGGRVQTLRDGFTPGLHADGGAAFIPGSHTLTVGFATHFGLRLDPIPTAPGASVDFLRGVRVVDTTAAAAQWPVTLGAAEAGRPPIAWLIDYIKAAIPQILATDPRAPGWPPPALQAFDDVTFHHFLTDQGASEGAIEVLRLGFPDLWGDGIDATSALLILRDTAYAFASAPSAGGGPSGTAHPASRHFRAFAANATLPDAAGATAGAPIASNLLYRISGGSDVLPSAFAAHIGPHIRYGKPVTRLTHTPTGVHVECNGGEETFESDYVICTIPFVVLQDIPIDPPLPYDKSAAICGLPYTSVTRIFLEFTSRYWQGDGFIGTAATDLPTSASGPRPGLWIEDATATQNTSRGILDCYFVGSAARDVQSMRSADRIAHALACVEQVFPGAQEHFSGNAMYKCWDEDPYARGDYCWYRPGQMTALTPVIGRSEGRIHFAGDHTSALPGWIQGALESGLRAAQEVNDAQ